MKLRSTHFHSPSARVAAVLTLASLLLACGHSKPSPDRLPSSPPPPAPLQAKPAEKKSSEGLCPPAPIGSLRIEERTFSLDASLQILVRDIFGPVVWDRSKYGDHPPFFTYPRGGASVEVFDMENRLRQGGPLGKDFYHMPLRLRDGHFVALEIRGICFVGPSEQRWVDLGFLPLED